MRVFVTGVGGQLGHDVMNELAKRGYEGVGSDIAPSYSGIADSTAVTTMPYVQMDITDKSSVEKVIKEAKVDAVIHCAAWTAVKCSISPQTMCSMAKELLHGNRTAKTINH